MTEYSAGLLFNDTNTSVVLIRKQRPSWQKGRWNAIGGHIEVGETPYKAQIREFCEETGVRLDTWEPFAILSGADFKVHFFRAFSSDSQRLVSTKTDEVVERFLIDCLPGTVLPNVRWLIQMALSMDLDRANLFHIEEDA